MSRTLTVCWVLLASGAVAHGELVITVGDHILIPDVPGQTVQAFVSGGDEVAGVNFFAQVGDGGPELADYGLPPGTDGPAISAVDLKTGTIFDGTPDSQFDLGSIPQVVNYGFVISEPDATVLAEGVLVTLTIDMSGFSSGNWELLLGDVLPELGPFDTDFASTPAIILNGSITAALPGDANLDSQVADLDASILATHWQQSGMSWKDADFNNDGIVNDTDASILATHWQQTWEGEGLAAVPEPATLIVCFELFTLGLLIAWRRLRPGTAAPLSSAPVSFDPRTGAFHSDDSSRSRNSALTRSHRLLTRQS